MKKSIGEKGTLRELNKSLEIELQKKESAIQKIINEKSIDREAAIKVFENESSQPNPDSADQPSVNEKTTDKKTEQPQEPGSASTENKTPQEPVIPKDTPAQKINISQKPSQIFEGIKHATQQDARTNSTVQTIVASIKDDTAPPILNEKNKVIDPEMLKRKHWARAGLYINGCDTVVGFLCNWVAGDWSSEGWKKYTLPVDQKLSVRTSIYEVMMIKNKETNPSTDIWGAIIFGYLPIVGMAIMTGVQKKKEKEAAAKAAVLERKNQQPAQHVQQNPYQQNPFGQYQQYQQTQHHQQNPWIVPQQYAPPQNPNFQPPVNTTPPRSIPNPDGIKTSRKGQHKATCPKRGNPNGICNCK